MAYSEPGAFTPTINYYRAAWKGLWGSKEETSPVIDIPVDVIWGELDVFAGKEMATPPKALVPKAIVKFLPQVSSRLYAILILGGWVAFLCTTGHACICLRKFAFSYLCTSYKTYLVKTQNKGAMSTAKILVIERQKSTKMAR